MNEYIHRIAGVARLYGSPHETVYELMDQFSRVAKNALDNPGD